MLRKHIKKKFRPQWNQHMFLNISNISTNITRKEIPLIFPKKFFLRISLKGVEGFFLRKILMPYPKISDYSQCFAV